MTITWRTVNGPSSSEALKPMESAQRSFNSMFDIFNAQLEKRQAANSYQEGETKKNNYEDFLSQVSQFGTPEEFEAAQKSGAIQSILGKYNKDQIDGAAVRNYLEARPGDLMARNTQNQAYGDSQDERRFAPLRDMYERILVTEGPEAAAAYMEQAQAEHGLTNTAQHYQSGDARAQELQNRDRAEIKWDDSREDRGFAQDARNIAAEDRRINQFDRLSEQSMANSEQLAEAQRGTVGSPGGLSELTQLLAETVPEEDLGNVMGVVNSAIRSNPIFNSLPLEVVQQIALAHAPNVNWHTRDSTVQTNITKDLEAAAIEHRDRMMATQLNRDNLIARGRQLNTRSEAAERAAFPQWFENRVAPQAQGVAGQPGVANAANPVGPAGALVADGGGSDEQFRAAMDEARAAGRLPPAFDRAAGTGIDPVSAENAPNTPETSTPETQQSPVDNLESTLRNKLIELEQEEMAAGIREKHSDEVNKLLEEQVSSDREMLNKVGSAVWQGIGAGSTLAGDVITLAPRGVFKGVNTALRVPNAYGANIPTIPDNGMLSSWLPFSNMRRARNDIEVTESDLKERRKKLEDELKKLRDKK